MDKWGKLTLFLIIGYLSASRSFAYLGIPWINIYIGEIALATFLFFGPSTKQGSWIRFVWRIRRFRRFEHLVLLLLFYGAFEALHGICSGYPAFTAARDTAFNYYSLFVLLGVWAGLRDRDLLRRTALGLAWWNGCYGLAYVLFLSAVPWAMPGTTNRASEIVPLFSEPIGSGIAILGLFAFEPKLRRVWYLLVLNAVVMLWVQMRAEWFGFIVGLFVFAWLTKRIRPLLIACGILIAVIGIMYLGDVHLPSAKGRGGQISVDAIIARGVAPIDKSMADNLAPPEDVVGYAGTAKWRLVWWANIWETIHSNPLRALIGLGYGYPIGDLNPFIEQGRFIQTPHNDFFYALGYSGWIGVVIFVLLQIELLRLLWRSYKVTGQPFGLMCWTALIVLSMFGDFFESPMGGISFFLVMGVALAPALLGKKKEPSRHIGSAFAS